MMIAHIFGKEGCGKCAALNKRLDAILQQELFKRNFRKQYHDILKEESLILFCQAQCINPNRIPALIISDEEGNYLQNNDCGNNAPVFGNAHLWQFLGIQTDYSDEGKGIIKPEMIEAVLNEAMKENDK